MSRDLGVALRLAQGLAPALLHTGLDGVEILRQVEFESVIVRADHRGEAVHQESQRRIPCLELLVVDGEDVEPTEGEVIDERREHRLRAVCPSLGQQGAALDVDEPRRPLATGLPLDEGEIRTVAGHHRAPHRQSAPRLVAPQGLPQ